MAKINTTTLTITVSQMLRDNESPNVLLDNEMVAQLEAVITQLASEGAKGAVIVEIQTQ